MLDLLITNASLPDGRTGMSIAIQNGCINEVTPGLSAPATETIDAKGYLLTPPFCDAHFHMDSALTYGEPRVNESGTLLEGIQLWGELKPTLKAEAIIERARLKSYHKIQRKEDQLQQPNGPQQHKNIALIYCAVQQHAAAKPPRR